MTNFITLITEMFLLCCQVSPQIVTVHNSVAHPPFEQHRAGPPSTMPQFLFQSIKGLSKDCQIFLGSIILVAIILIYEKFLF